MIARVRGVTAAAIFAGSMFIVRQSMSTKTGTTLWCRQQVADDGQV